MDVIIPGAFTSRTISWHLPCTGFTLGDRSVFKNTPLTKMQSEHIVHELAGRRAKQVPIWNKSEHY